jgi:hypothetical protein
VEPGTTERIAAELDRIESAVRTGRTDLRELGFWGTVDAIKRDPELVAVFADRVGRIDTVAFLSAVRIRVPVWIGNVVLLVGIVLGAVAIAITWGLDRASGSADALTGILTVGAGLAWMVSFHSPSHWLVGRLVGIRFTAYTLRPVLPPVPGLKTEYASYLRTPAARRAWMHASGAIATKVAPFLALAIARWSLIPPWAVVVLVVIGLGQIVTDLVISTKRSDWKRFLRERRIAASSG